MSQIEKRECERFEIPGATLMCTGRKGLFKKSGFGTDELPVYDVSFGGVRFLSQHTLKVDTAVSVKLFTPEDEKPLIFEGRIVRISHHTGRSYTYQIGIQFLPYRERKGFNPPENLARLKAYAEKYAAAPAAPAPAPGHDLA